MKVDWTERARADLADVRESRAQISEESAARLVVAILRRTRQLGQFPQSGRVIPEFQAELLRELIEGEYRILYEIHPDRLEVFGVISARRKLVPDELLGILANPEHD